MCFSQQCTAEIPSNGAGAPADHEPCLGKSPGWLPSLSLRLLRLPQPTLESTGPGRRMFPAHLPSSLFYGPQEYWGMKSSFSLKGKRRGELSMYTLGLRCCPVCNVTNHML